MNSKLIIRIYTKETYDTRDLVIGLKNEYKMTNPFMLINSDSVDIRINKSTILLMRKMKDFCRGFLCGRRIGYLATFEE